MHTCIHNYICHAPFNTRLSPSFTSETQSTHPLRNIQQSAHTQVYLEASPPVGVWHMSPDTVERLDARPVTILPLHTSGVPKSGVGVLSFFILFPMTALTTTRR